jgi:hypothetical protein
MGIDCRGVACQILSGYQRVVKGHYRGSSTSHRSSGGGQSEYVIIFLVVIRLQDKNTDVVVSVNYPVRDAEGVEAIHDTDLGTVERWIQRDGGVKEAETVLRDVVNSFEVVDWSLFDEDDEDDDEEDD